MTSRRPHWVYDAGDEPDPRFSLANERTFLAWVRTALALLAGAIALDSFGVPETDGLRLGLVLVLLGFAALSTVLAWLRWARVERAMRTKAPLPPFSLGLVIAVGVVAIAVLLAAGLAL